jgi:hypothetical protein
VPELVLQSACHLVFNCFDFSRDLQEVAAVLNQVLQL